MNFQQAREFYDDWLLAGLPDDDDDEFTADEEDDGNMEKLCIFCKNFPWTKETLWGMGGTLTRPLFIFR